MTLLRGYHKNAVKRTTTSIFTELMHSVPSLQCLILGPVEQSVASPTADPGVSSLMLALSYTFEEIDHEIISTVILLSSADSRRFVVSYKRMYVHEVLVNCLVKLAQEKVLTGM